MSRLWVFVFCFLILDVFRLRVHDRQACEFSVGDLLQGRITLFVLIPALGSVFNKKWVSTLNRLLQDLEGDGVRVIGLVEKFCKGDRNIFDCWFVMSVLMCRYVI